MDIETGDYRGEIAMTPPTYPLQVWRNTLGHKSNPIIHICIGAAPGYPHFGTLVIPLDRAEAIIGKEVIEKVGEEPRLANLKLDLEEVI